MSRAFEVLDVRPTRMGEIMLRRRLEPVLQIDIWEVKLGDEFLMSSMFTATEEAVGRLGTTATPGDELRVVVGGLGLGCTAAAALEDERVAELFVIDALYAVIDWHERGLVPLGPTLVADDRCAFVHGDFFAMAHDGIDAGVGPPFDAILVDIDHTPGHHLDDSHAGFYSEAGLQRVVDQLVPGGTFALWSDDPPDAAFMALLGRVFTDVRAEVVEFPNHYTGANSACTVYLAHP
ncbi:MAG: spermidine synthase [Acidimicrobiaceae bacterium]|nr:spermidine synthase [Acidimicrobiaceae bacterium]